MSEGGEMSEQSQELTVEDLDLIERAAKKDAEAGDDYPHISYEELLEVITFARRVPELEEKFAFAQECHQNACQELIEKDAEIKRLREAQAIVDEQAEQTSLWFFPQHITEDILQKALRRLHVAIEGKTPEECVREILD